MIMSKQPLGPPVGRHQESAASVQIEVLFVSYHNSSVHSSHWSGYT